MDLHKPTHTGEVLTGWFDDLDASVPPLPYTSAAAYVVACREQPCCRKRRYPRMFAMASTSADAPSKEKARKVQTEISLTASWNRPQFVPHMKVKAGMDSRTFFSGEDVCLIASGVPLIGRLLTEEPHWDLHVNEVIHGYHVRQFEINFEVRLM